jgi:hypothetical protein
MATFKNVAWYFAIGFAGNQLLSFLGVNAVPTALAAKDITLRCSSLFDTQTRRMRESTKEDGFSKVT